MQNPTPESRGTDALSHYLAQKASFTAKINCQTPVAAWFGAQCTPKIYQIEGPLLLLLSHSASSQMLTGERLPNRESEN